MGRKSKFSKEQKIEICRRYLDGSESVTSLAEVLNRKLYPSDDCKLYYPI